MIFDSKNDAAFARVGATFLECLNAILPRDCEWLTFRIPGKYTDVWNTHQRGVVDPRFRLSDFLLSLFDVRDGKRISDARAAEFNPSHEGMPFQFEQKFSGGI